MQILVTGASGYIGSHVCKILYEHGHTVTGWDNCFHGEENDVIAWCNGGMHHVDVTDNFKTESFDAVVHLAGRSVVPDSMIDPAEYYRVNIQGTQNVLQNISTPHFIFASTSSAWEMASPYARSKVAAEDIIKQFADGYTIFRFFNVSGSDGINRQLGKPTHLIRVMAKVATGKQETLKIYGDDYETRDGTCIRDYVHIVDLANAIVTAAEKGPLNTPYECLGSNVGWSVYEVKDAMEKAISKKIPFEVVERRHGDAVASVVDQLSKRIQLTKSIEDMCRDQYNLERSLNYESNYTNV